MHIGTYWSDPWTGPKILVFKPKRGSAEPNRSIMPKGMSAMQRRYANKVAAATKIQKLFRGYRGRKKAKARATKVYSRTYGGRAGYLAGLRSKRSYYSSIGKAKGKRSAYY